MQARWGWPIGIAALGFLLGAFLATQGVALHYDWRPALGRPWFHWGGVPFWGPLDYFKWRSIAEAALAAIEVFKEKYGAKYAPAVACLTKDCEALLAFYDFPAEPLGRPSLPPYGTDHRLCR